MIDKKNGLLSLVGTGVLVIAFLLWIFRDGAQYSPVAPESHKFFAIVPHFTLQERTIKNFYQHLQSTYAIARDEPLNIVLISPDHFHASENDVDTLCQDVKRFCWKDNCVPAKALLFPTIKQSGCLSPHGTSEHGLGEEFRFVNTTFPKAKVYPIVIKPRTFMDDAALIQQLMAYPFVGKTLFLASVDFSHYTDEDFAALHDQKTLYVLNSTGTTSQYAALEVDCPSCLYTLNTLAQQSSQYPQRFLRDSSSTIAGSNLGSGNTSRQFIAYSPLAQTGDQGFTLAFFGDTIFDRQVATRLNTGAKINEYFKTFFEKGDTQLPLASNIHRKLFGIDVVGLNLETPMVANPAICQSTHKLVNFCSSSILLPYLKALGFTLVNLANNHSLDGGTQAHLETVQQLKENGLNYIGHIRNGTYFEKDYTYKTVIRGIKVAFQGFDFTITPRGLFSGYCAALKKNKADGYVNVVSVHRGTEYQSTHNVSQESLGKQLIDCGADMIIGTHPHVIQDIQRYKGKPIIYSLGNFLFDMKTPPAAMTGGYVLIDYHKDGTIHLSTGTVRSSVFSQ